jgi:hypothetical protein
MVWKLPNEAAIAHCRIDFRWRDGHRCSPCWQGIDIHRRMRQAAGGDVFEEPYGKSPKRSSAGASLFLASSEILTLRLAKD